MAYPSPTAINQLAAAPPTGLGIEPIRIFAFAAQYARLPSLGDLATFDAAVGAWASQVGVNPAFGYAYVEQYGSLPSTLAAFNAFQAESNINYASTKDKTWAALSAQFAGLNYPPGGSAPDPAGASGTAPGATPAASGISVNGAMAWATAHPLYVAGGGLAALLLLRRR